MKILMVLTSHDQLGNTGKKTGFWLEELAAPYVVFQDAGADVLYAPGLKTRDEIATVLRLRHRINDEDDFTISSQQETIETLEETTNTFIVFLGAIASISLWVGGIGIMNIMLVSVTERTREIGIRKAMGAKRRDILLQFVSEATLLSLGGGAAGVLLGLVLSILLNGRSLLGTPTQTVFSPEVAVLALVVSAAIGLFFGIYPAMRAARLHPIEALRYE